MELLVMTQIDARIYNNSLFKTKQIINKTITHFTIKHKLVQKKKKKKKKKMVQKKKKKKKKKK